MTESRPVVYSYEGKLFNLKTLKFLDKDFKGEYTEYKRDNHHADFFGSGHEDLKAAYKELVFELQKDRSIKISDTKGTLVKTIPDPDLNIRLDHTSGNTVFFATATGVISILRLEGENGYRVLKYNEKGENTGKWKLEHTQYTVTGNTRYSKPYLYYRARTDQEIVFSSIHTTDPQKIIVLNHVSGIAKTSSGTVGGIILNQDMFLGGLIVNGDNRTIHIQTADATWTIDNPYSHNTYKTVLEDRILYFASYHWISTGSALGAFDMTTGKQIWKGDVKQLNTSHSEYYNTVYLTKFEDKLILEGEEAHGNYLQVLDAKTGKSLFSTIEW